MPPTLPPRLALFSLLALATLSATSAQSADWIHWRGPEQTGQSREKNLPGDFDAHTTAGELLCLDKDGKKVWSRQLTEEFGRVTGYGGRIVSPIFDSDMVIVGAASSSWGDQARGLNRFLAFDGKTGQVVWITGVG